MKKLFFILIALVVFSCEDEDSSALTGQWLVQEYSYTVIATGVTVNLITECSVDDIYEFTPDEVFKILEGEKICMPPRMRTTEKYALRNNGREIWFQYGDIWKIKRLNLITCEIEVLVPPVLGIKSLKLVLRRA